MQRREVTRRKAIEISADAFPAATVVTSGANPVGDDGDKGRPQWIHRVRACALRAGVWRSV